MTLRWQKLGKIFDPVDLRGRTWMHEFAQSPSALVFPDHVRVYFCSRPAPSANGMYLSYVAAVDLDRGDLRRVVQVCDAPLLSLGALGTFDEFGTNPISVIRDGGEVRIYYAGWTRCESVPVNAAIGVAISRDGGTSFRRLGDGPVLSYAPDEPFMVGSPRIRRFGGRWVLWYVSGKEWLRPQETCGRPEPVYKIRMATSADGLDDWKRVGRDLLEDRLGPRECQASADVLERDGRYHMLFSYRRSHEYKGKDGGYRIGYAVSDDMFEWRRQDEVAGIAVSETGWDSVMACYPNVFELDGATYMLYQGNEMGRTGFGLAKLVEPAVWGGP